MCFINHCWTGVIFISKKNHVPYSGEPSIKAEDIRLFDDASLFMLSSLSIPFSEDAKKLSFSPLDVHYLHNSNQNPGLN